MNADAIRFFAQAQDRGEDDLLELADRSRHICLTVYDKSRMAVKGTECVVRSPWSTRTTYHE